MPRKRTNEEFIKVCSEKFPDYEVLSEYKNNSTKVKFRHIACGHEFEKTPGHFLSGQGCPKCSMEMKAKKLSGGKADDFFASLNKMSFELVDPEYEYTNCFAPVEVKCRKCGRVSTKTPANIMRGHGCKYCSGLAPWENFNIKKELKKRAPEWELAGEYVNMRTPAVFVHKPCGMKYSKIPMAVLSAPGSCKFCNAKKLAATHEDFLKKVSGKTDYEVLSKYTNSSTKVHIKHLVCGHDFWCLPLNFAKRKEGCPFCKNRLISERRTMTHEEFVEALGPRAKEFVFLSTYKGAHQPIKVKHSCGYIMTTTPDNLVRKGRCPGCQKTVGEKEVFDFIKTLTNEEVLGNDRKTLPNKRELDIYIPSKKLAIEYDGLLYHSVEWLAQRDGSRKFTKEEAENFSLWKTKECGRLGIRLIHLFEDEWVHKRPIAEDKLRAIFLGEPNKFFARKLKVKPITSKEASAFYEENHIQGETRYSVSVGLFSGDKLVAAQSFVRGSRKNGQSNGSWELVRYATLLGTVVVGGFSRCLKWFEREYSPREVVSFADLRICDQTNNVYEKNGFVKDCVTKPDYWYAKGNKRYHKSRFRKDGFKRHFPNIYSPEKTEREMAKEAKLLTVYDCGKIRYVKTF